MEKIAYQGFDSVIFYIEYKDGNGDIGLSQSDTFYPYQLGGKFYHNIIIDYLEKDGANFRKVKPPFSNIDTIVFAYRIPVLNTSKKDKPILGDIKVGVRLDLPPLYSNTSKFKIRLFDKALNESNTIETPEIQR